MIEGFTGERRLHRTQAPSYNDNYMTETKFNILVLGSGGREHALCWKIADSPLCARLFCAPGNGGTAAIAENVKLDEKDHDAVIAFCRENTIALVVIGPEAPLVDGLADTLQAHDVAAFGPSGAAQIP